MNYPIHENHGFHPSYKHFVPLEYIAQRDNTCEVVNCTPLFIQTSLQIFYHCTHIQTKPETNRTSF